MKERPILFSAPMVRAILDGTKTQTRRIVKPQPPEGTAYVIAEEDPDGKGALCVSDRDGSHAGEFAAGVDPWRRCPYSDPGDRLWVRETWQAVHYSTDYETGIIDDEDAAPKIPKDNSGQWWTVKYAATHPDGSAHPSDRVPWRPAIHMPRWASRITLAVESIRVERLQAITEEDARAEGVTPAPFCKAGRPDGMEHVEAFEILWKDINGAESWAANPWVWVVGFSRVAP